jgi:anaerobic ribonucleoside-triphosphate reductase activating protein
MNQPLRYVHEQIVWQEVPGETSLAYTIAGCPLRCEGCHSSEYRNPSRGYPLTVDYFVKQLNNYQGLISCVLFLGGEWHQALTDFLAIAKQHHLHTCLYTGLESAPDALLPYLTYIKTGPWISELGGLDNPTTNQRFIDLRTGHSLNHHFHSHQ